MYKWNEHYSLLPRTAPCSSVTYRSSSVIHNERWFNYCIKCQSIGIIVHQMFYKQIHMYHKAILLSTWASLPHDDVIKWKHLPRYWPFVQGIHRSPVNSPHKGQWRGALIFSFICDWIHDWVNNREAGYLIRHRANYDVIVIKSWLNHYIKTWDTNHSHIWDEICVLKEVPGV